MTTQACSTIAQATPADFLSWVFSDLIPRSFFHMLTKLCTLLDPGRSMLVWGEQSFSLLWALKSSFR